MKKKLKKKLPSLAKIRKTLWTLTSHYVRRSAAGSNGYAACVTCGAVARWQALHAGHFVPQARGLAIRYRLDNIHPQCYRCNINLGSNPGAYALYMIERYGVEKIRELESAARGIAEYRRSDYEVMIGVIKSMIADLG